MKKILVPTDFSENATIAVNYAVALAIKAKAEIILLNVFAIVETPFSITSPLVNEVNSSIFVQMKEQLEALKQTIERNNPLVKIRTRLYTKGIKDSIMECASEENVDLIVISTHGATGLEKLFFGSVTSSVITHSAVPVLVIPKETRWDEQKNVLFETD